MKEKPRGSATKRATVIKESRRAVSKSAVVVDPIETARNDARESVRKFEKDFHEIGKALRK